jgi:crotonobetainyl-CoA:carnitine CoA-transferase CaiB-like acyl-CoA transferase
MKKPAPVAKVPVWMSETPGSIRHRAPKLGEHTERIMSDLGYTESEIVELRAKGVI